MYGFGMNALITASLRLKLNWDTAILQHNLAKLIHSFTVTHSYRKEDGGSNKFDNLMPILAPNHRLITSWFNNY